MDSLEKLQQAEQQKYYETEQTSHTGLNSLDYVKELQEQQMRQTLTPFQRIQVKEKDTHSFISQSSANNFDGDDDEVILQERVDALFNSRIAPEFDDNDESITIHIDQSVVSSRFDLKSQLFSQNIGFSNNQNFPHNQIFKAYSTQQIINDQFDEQNQNIPLVQFVQDEDVMSTKNTNVSVPFLFQNFQPATNNQDNQIKQNDSRKEDISMKYGSYVVQSESVIKKGQESAHLNSQLQYQNSNNHDQSLNSKKSNHTNIKSDKLQPQMQQLLTFKNIQNIKVILELETEQVEYQLKNLKSNTQTQRNFSQNNNKQNNMMNNDSQNDATDDLKEKTSQIIYQGLEKFIQKLPLILGKQNFSNLVLKHADEQLKDHIDLQKVDNQQVKQDISMHKDQQQVDEKAQQKVDKRKNKFSEVDGAFFEDEDDMCLIGSSDKQSLIILISKLTDQIQQLTQNQKTLIDYNISITQKYKQIQQKVHDQTSSPLKIPILPGFCQNCQNIGDSFKSSEITQNKESFIRALEKHQVQLQKQQKLTKFDFNTSSTPTNNEQQKLKGMIEQQLLIVKSKIQNKFQMFQEQLAKLLSEQILQKLQRQQEIVSDYQKGISEQNHWEVNGKLHHNSILGVTNLPKGLIHEKIAEETLFKLFQGFNEDFIMSIEQILTDKIFQANNVKEDPIEESEVQLLEQIQSTDQKQQNIDIQNTPSLQSLKKQLNTFVRKASKQINSNDKKDQKVKDEEQDQIIEEKLKKEMNQYFFIMQKSQEDNIVK
eukprot:403340727